MYTTWGVAAAANLDSGNLSDSTLYTWQCSFHLEELHSIPFWNRKGTSFLPTNGFILGTECCSIHSIISPHYGGGSSGRVRFHVSKISTQKESTRAKPSSWQPSLLCTPVLCNRPDTEGFLLLLFFVHVYSAVCHWLDIPPMSETFARRGYVYVDDMTVTVSAWTL